jgi:hypothetical protein
MVTFDLLDALSIPFILFLGIVTSYSDIKYKKIRNKYVIMTLIYAVLSLLIATGYAYYKGSGINPHYLILFLTNIGVSLLFGVLLWISHLWSAGDAKLFLAYAALVPLKFYKWGSIGIFPSYILLINTFTPAFAYFLARLIYQLNLKATWQEIKIVFNPKDIFILTLYFIGFYWGISKTLLFMGITSNLVFIIIILFFILTSNVLKKINIYLSGALLFLRIVTDIQSIKSIPWELLSVLAFLILKLLINLGYYVFSKQMYIESLKENMSLAEDIVIRKGKYIRVKEVSYFLYSGLFRKKKEESIFSDYRKLNSEDVKKIQKLHSEGKFEDHIVYIRDNIPFAILLFLGVLLTLIVKGNFLTAILSESFL